jgi:hypothetical protein
LSTHPQWETRLGDLLEPYLQNMPAPQVDPIYSYIGSDDVTCNAGPCSNSFIFIDGFHLSTSMEESGNSNDLIQKDGGVDPTKFEVYGGLYNIAPTC